MELAKRGSLVACCIFVEALIAPTAWPRNVRDGTLVSSSASEEEGGHLLGYGNSSHAPSTLQRIATRRLETALEAVERGEAAEEQAFGPGLDVYARLKREGEVSIAAEFKRASPSKGSISALASVATVASEYASAGVALISVLTEPEWFGGSLEDMAIARRAASGLPDRPAILCKDFILHEHQLREAKAFGADAALLIVACLTKSRLKYLVETCWQLGLEPLVEAHTEREMELALGCGARCLGINNRNLHTFELDMATTRRLALLVPEEQRSEIVIASLSGFSTAADVTALGVDIDCVLVGEALMRAPDKVTAIQALRSAQQDEQFAVAKVCGLTRVQDALEAARSGADLLGVIFAPGSKREVSTEEASAIVDAVRAFGERTSRWVPTSADSLAERTANLARATRRGRPLVVGVVQDQSLEDALRLREDAKLDLLQLHGNESLKFAEAVGPHIRVVHVPINSDVDRLLEMYGPALDLHNCYAVLLDTQLDSGHRGGTGLTCDPDLAAQFAHKINAPVILAGGLDAPALDHLPERAVAFLGFDASSKLEAKPGLKDSTRVRDFVAAVKRRVTSS